MSTAEKVIELIAIKSELGRDADIDRSQNLRDDLKLDSLDIVELWMDLDKAFGIEIPSEVIESLTDVQSVIDAVESMIGAKMDDVK
ncbi:MAG: phosphopantetheine-binding protein [Rikenellaceae bacterium]